MVLCHPKALAFVRFWYWEWILDYIRISKPRFRSQLALKAQKSLKARLPEHQKMFHPMYMLCCFRAFGLSWDQDLNLNPLFFKYHDYKEPSFLKVWSRAGLSHKAQSKSSRLLILRGLAWSKIHTIFQGISLSWDQNLNLNPSLTKI